MQISPGTTTRKDAADSAPVNIASVLPAMAATQPNQAAIYFPTGRDTDGARQYAELSYAALDEQSDLIAQALTEYGIGRGVRTALMVKPSLEFFALTFAIFKAGAVPVMIDPGIGLKNIKKCLAQAAPSAFIGIPQAHIARLLFGWGRGSIKTLVTVGRKLGWGGRTLRDLKARTTPDPAWTMAATRPDETAAIMFTSGSTGTPKGVVYRHATFVAQVEAIRALYDIQPGEIDLPTFPLFALFDPALGMTTVIPEMDFSRPATIDPSVVRDAVERFGITNMFGSPAVLNAVSRWGEQHDVQFHSLRRVISAGAPVPAVTLARMRRCLPEVADIVTPYGATESLPVASIESREVLQETAAATASGAGVCVGRPVPTIDLKIIEITDTPIPRLADAAEVPQGDIGEVLVRGEVVTHRYFEQPDATALAKIYDEEGVVWHRMGDLGYLDETGRLWFCGRKAHRVCTAHGTIFSVPVEGIFNTHPEVFRSALIGLPDGEAGAMTPAICVELEPNVPSSRAAKVTAEVLEIAAEHPQTAEIRRCFVHPGFPVDIRHNAKINRPALAQWAARHAR